jgi:hypothetical protein
MSSMAARHAGWVNLAPEPAEEEAETASLFGIFAPPAPRVPMCTWVPGRERRGRVEPSSVGLEHAAGPKVAEHLRTLGHPLPEAWRVVQDHPKRGLVVLLPEGEAPAGTLGWLMPAAEKLSQLRLTGRWTALLYR